MVVVTYKVIDYVNMILYLIELHFYVVFMDEAKLPQVSKTATGLYLS